MDARWSENAKCYIFEISPKNKNYFSLIPIDQKHEMCPRNTILTFQCSLGTRLKILHAQTFALNILKQHTLEHILVDVYYPGCIYKRILAVCSVILGLGSF